MAGGMGLVDIQDYYRASILAQLGAWIGPNPDILWSDVEQALSPTKNLQSLLFLDVWQLLSLPKLPFTIQASLLAWRDLHRLSTPTSSSIDIPIPLNTLAHAIPNLQIFNWRTKGINLITNLYQNNTIKTFPTLQAQFKLTQTATHITRFSTF